MNTRNIHWLTLAALCTVLVAYGDNGSLDTVELALENTAGHTVQTSLLPATMDERSQLLLPTHINHRPVSWIVDTDDAPLELVKNEQGQITLHSQDVVEDTPVELVASDTSRHTLTIKEIDAQKLPPKPKFFAAQKTIEGIDTDGDGVRDEVEHGLYELYGENHQLFRASYWSAYKYQALLNSANEEDMQKQARHAREYMILTSCFRLYSGIKGYARGDYAAAIEALVVNTPERKKASSHADVWLGKNRLRAVLASKEECDQYEF